jgi:hypothetical protein
MRDGFRVYDTDTHIDPGADVLEKYIDPGFRPRLDDLAPYRVEIKSRTVDGGVRRTYRFAQRLYERTLGEAESKPGTGDGRVASGGRASVSSTTVRTTASSTWTRKAPTRTSWCRRCGPASSACPTCRSKWG